MQIKQSRSPSSSPSSSRRKSILAFLTACAFLIAIISAILISATPKPAKLKKRNVIFMISDGYGPGSATFARTYFQYLQSIRGKDGGKDGGPTPEMILLPLDEILRGSVRTFSSDSRVTDSAAGATAFACGIKTKNHVCGLDNLLVPCPTIMELAKSAGFKTGLVVTSRVTHATPASFTAHVVSRNMENEIAKFQIGLGQPSFSHPPDLIMGGGRCHFLPNTDENSCRSDNLHLLHIAEKEKGFQVFQNFSKLPRPTAKTDKKILGLFSLDHMKYELDRQSDNVDDEPSLWNMTKYALDYLSCSKMDKAETESSNIGFFLLVEGSRIDMAAHSNDAVSHYHDIMAYQETVQGVRSWMRERVNNAEDEETILISVSDHETGGLVLNRQDDMDTNTVYDWWPWNLAGQLNSTLKIAQHLSATKEIHQNAPEISKTILEPFLGISDATVFELNLLMNATSNPAKLDKLLATMKSKRALLGWTTFGHSAVDVHVYADSTKRTSSTSRTLDRIYGTLDNTDLNKILVDFMGLETFRQDAMRNFGQYQFEAIRHAENGDRESVNGNVSSAHFQELHFHSDSSE
jgi:alkaline phosphatase